MDKILKNALDNNAVDFISRLKDKMTAYKDDVISDITRQTAADMAGVEVHEAKILDESVLKLKDDKLIAWIKKNDTDEPGISPEFGKQIKSAKAEAKKRGLKIQEADNLNESDAGNVINKLSDATQLLYKVDLKPNVLKKIQKAISTAIGELNSLK